MSLLKHRTAPTPDRKTNGEFLWYTLTGYGALFFLGIFVHVQPRASIPSSKRASMEQFWIPPNVP